MRVLSRLLSVFMLIAFSHFARAMNCHEYMLDFNARLALANADRDRMLAQANADRDRMLAQAEADRARLLAGAGWQPAPWHADGAWQPMPPMFGESPQMAALRLEMEADRARDAERLRQAVDNARQIADARVAAVEARCRPPRACPQPQWQGWHGGVVNNADKIFGGGVIVGGVGGWNHPHEAPRPARREWQPFHEQGAFVQAHTQLPANFKHLRELITFDETMDLIKISVAKIPELQSIWNWRRQSGNSIYFGGGGLRGLLYWLLIQLNHYPLATVRQMRIPSIDELLLQQNSDYDMYAASHLIEVIKQQFPEYSRWDILNLGTNDENTKLGGAALEKIRCNPEYIDDPLQGLWDFYNGIIEFHWSPDEIFNTNYWVINLGMSRMAEGLRYIRFPYNLRGFRTTPASVEKIRGIGTGEAANFVRSEQKDYWIKKGIKKLYLATGNDLAETRRILGIYGLLAPLERLGYEIPGPP